MNSKIFKSICAICAFCGFVACVDNDDVPENMYTAQKMTAAQFLEANPEQFGDFTALLKRTPYFSLLTTYGRYTLFAATNDAVANFASRRGFASIDQLPQDLCDTIARTHIIKEGAFFTTDVVEGTLPQLNMLDAFIVWSSDSDVVNDNKIIYYVNKNSRMLEYNDSVTNGVVHVVDNIITASNDFLPDKMEEDPSLTIFCEALRLTGMADSLTRYMDETYTCGDDSVYNGTRERCTNGSDLYMTCKWVGTRYFKYTALVEPDSVYHQHGINDIEDLKAYAKQVYDQTYPEDAGLYDDDFKHRKNPLNRFVSYHLLDRVAQYNQFVISGPIREKCWRSSIADPEEFYETMCPGTLVRFASPAAGAASGLYINRRGSQGRLYNNDPQCRGVKVLSPSESGSIDQNALNGVYHYIDDILVFSPFVRDVIFNCRLRFDPATLSPDFMNCDGRGRQGSSELRGFKRGYVTNFDFTKETFLSVTPDQDFWWSFLGHVLCISGRFDITFKLPTVPNKGTYEIRMGYTPGEERGVIQVYLDNNPCGIPIDLRVGGGAPEIGAIADTDDEEQNRLNDKAMHNRGYMKAMDCYFPGGGETAMRELGSPLRRILATEYLEPGKEYYLRVRQVLDDPMKYWNFNYLELCPKSVYASPQGEDTH